MYTEKIFIKSTDVTLKRTLRPSALLSMAQNATGIHTTKLGVGSDKTLDRGFLWVIVRQELKISRMPEYEETVTLETWPGEAKHMFFPRYTRLLDGSGAVLATVSAIWTLIDINSRAMIIPSKEGISIPCEKTGNDLPLPGRIRSIPVSASVEYTVPFSAADINGHLGNMHYLDIAEDCISEISSVRDPKCIRCEYSNEIKYKEKVTVSFGSDGDRYYFSGDGDKHKFDLLFEY